MRRLLVLVCASALLASSSAFAQSEAAKAQALKRYQEGLSLYDRGRDEEAYLQFSQAYAVVQSPPILFNLARTEQLTGRHVSAAEHFRAYLALPEHPRITKELRGKAQGFLTELAGQVGHLTLEVPAGAVVSLDGKDIPSVASVDVEPGPHTVAARVGEQRASVEVVAAAGAVTPARVVLASPTGPVVVVPQPVAPTNAPPAPLTPGPGGSHTARDALRWTTAGVAVAGLAVGTAFLLVGNSQASDFNSFAAANPNACQSPSSALCAQANSKLSDVSTSNTLTAVGFVVGGGSAITSAALWIFWPKDAPKAAASVWVVPMAGAGSYTVNVGGHF